VDSTIGLAADSALAAGAVCSATAAGGVETSAGAAGAWAGREGVNILAATAAAGDLASCGTVFAGTATTADAAVNPDAGGFTITGPEGGREAIAGVEDGGADTIRGACRG
jgi:hypothetical protein